MNSEENIHAFLPTLAPLLGGGLVTMEKVKVIEYRAGKLNEQIARFNAVDPKLNCPPPRFTATSAALCSK